MGSEDNLESNGVCMKYENENVRGIKSMGESEEREVHPPKKLVYLKFDSRKIWNRTISALITKTKVQRYPAALPHATQLRRILQRGPPPNPRPTLRL